MEKYFSFQGRAKRQEYWAVVLISIAALMFGLIVVESGLFGALVAMVVGIGTLWALLAVTIRRLRDAGLHPFWAIGIFLPYIALVVTIVFGVIKSAEE